MLRLSMFVLSLLLLAGTGAAQAQFLFSTSFEDVKDWNMPRPPKNALGYGWELTHGTHPPPQKLDGSQLFDLFRVGATLFEPANVTPAYEIGDGNGRNSGRGLLYNVEVSGIYDTAGWTGGTPLGVWLGTAGQPDLYVRFYLRYAPGWKWNDTSVTPNTGAIQKLARISVFNGIPGNGKMGGPYAAPAYGGEIFPVWIPTWFQYISVTPSYNIFNSQERYAPNYTSPSSTDFYTTSPQYYPLAPPILASPAAHQARGVLWPTDGGWHCYELHAKMNSAPGVADGVSEFWLDGVNVFSKTNIPWVKTGGSMARSWNVVEVLDNADLTSYKLADQVSLPLYLDDVVMSTSYSGPPPKPNASAAGISDQSITVTFAAEQNGATTQTDGYRINYGTDPTDLGSSLTVAPTATEATFTNLSTATRYYFSVKAFNKGVADVNENQSLAATASAVTTDVVAPELTLDTLPSVTRTRRQVISGTVSDSGGIALVTVKVGEAAAVPASVNSSNWSYAIPALTEGGNSILVAARDLSGNEATARASTVLDTVPPALTVAPVSTPTIFTSQTISGSVSDLGGVNAVFVQVGDGERKQASITGSTWSYLLTSLQPGAATQVTVTARDAAGNESSRSPATLAAIGVLQAGDLSGDVTVGLEDAQLAMQMGVGIKQPDVGQLQRGDLAPLVGGVPRPDGVIDTGDAVLILGIIAGTTKF